MASELPSLAGRVCLVTGASRGIGKGIALVLGKAGATVYITGRTLESTEGKAGSLREVAKEQLLDTAGTPFYEQPLSMWDEINNVGLRSNFVAAYYAAQLMVPNKQGLIVNISSAGGLRYLFNIPYGVGKAANDRMMADMAVELKKTNIAAISLWPGPVQTETVSSVIQEDKPRGQQLAKVFKDSEDATFTGKAIAWLAADPHIMKKSGSVLIVAELAREYGFTDVGGNLPLSFRQVKWILRNTYPSLEWMAPEFLYMPCWVIGARMHKFKPPSKY
ncbi:hypothetical protein QZH41_018957 [Actinostola sp. cb2023]|nr:hypothetical protein QZH41_018957 [Actinostola sp. cb2023]